MLKPKTSIYALQQPHFYHNTASATTRSLAVPLLFLGGDARRSAVLGWLTRAGHARQDASPAVVPLHSSASAQPLSNPNSQLQITNPTKHMTTKKNHAKNLFF